jgi:hypothetical protein
MIKVVLKECGFKKFKFKFFNVGSIKDQSFVDASSSNITGIPLPMPMAWQEQFISYFLCQQRLDLNPLP